MFRTSLATKRLVGPGILALTITLAFSSCKKEEPPAVPENPAPQFTVYSFPLTDGSYWVYQHQRNDAAGNVIYIGGTDSTYVDGDTVIGANTYKKLRAFRSDSTTVPVYPLTIVRDSAGYIVDEHGAFIEHDNFTDTLDYLNAQNTFFVWRFMRHRDSVVTVPAGTFTTIDYESHLYCVDPNYQPSPRVSHALFADGVGKIEDVIFMTSSPDYFIRKLLRYHIN